LTCAGPLGSAASRLSVPKRAYGEAVIEANRRTQTRADEREKESSSHLLLIRMFQHGPACSTAAEGAPLQLVVT
jgi:hypothetical protein